MEKECLYLTLKQALEVVQKQKVEHELGGTNNYQSIADYQAGNNAANQATSDRVDQYIAATGQTGDVAAKTRADTIAASDKSGPNYNATTAGAIARQQQQYIDRNNYNLLTLLVIMR